MNILTQLTKYTLSAAIIISCSNKKDQFLFSSSRNGNGDIFIMNYDGSNMQQLTSSDLEEWAPVWITKEKISFLRQDGDKITRHKLNIQSKKEEEIPQPTNCILDDKNSLFADQGKRALYLCGKDIFLWDAITDSEVNLTEELSGVSNYPAWSHDFKSMLFTNNSSGSNDIYKMDIVSKNAIKLIDFDSNDERGSLSSDGSKLVFSSDRDHKGNQDIYILDVETQELTNIANSDGQELIARWSRDDKYIFFGSNKDGNWEIYSFQLEGEKISRLTNNPEFDGDPRVLLH
ncbi:TolB family protein [Fulvivirga lutimaris]|uniref:TolB family protein n=1 Tax=Fulvivirga lutimaris TaxID=1819566 RepID=UPI0012BB972F|nr:PD40 domain-containing protein [Fulvivirga lutimaris]MTI41744.1 hypothetical protein [Fulvivirga lutimaris]